MKSAHKKLKHSIFWIVILFFLFILSCRTIIQESTEDSSPKKIEPVYSARVFPSEMTPEKEDAKQNKLVSTKQSPNHTLFILSGVFLIYVGCYFLCYYVIFHNWTHIRFVARHLSLLEDGHRKTAKKTRKF